MFLNKVIIVGRLVRDPELKTVGDGTPITTFPVATNRTWKDKNGIKQEAVDFHNVIVFKKQAEDIAKYLTKGQQVLVEGRLQTKTYNDPQNGSKRYWTEIVAERVQFGLKAYRDGAEGGEEVVDVDTGKKKPYIAPQRQRQAPAVVAPGGQRTSPDQIDYPTEEIDPDDIPF